MTNTTLLRIQMILHNDSVASLAECLGLNRQSVSNKIKGKREFKQSEIAKIAERYSLTLEEVKEIFLNIR